MQNMHSLLWRPSKVLYSYPSSSGVESLFMWIRIFLAFSICKLMLGLEIYVHFIIILSCLISCNAC
jgi:hypothetical protein